MRKSIISKIKLSGNIVDDVYFYFMCRSLGYDFKLSVKSSVLYRSPAKFSEQMKQNTRFQARENEMEQYFGDLVG